MKKIRQTCSALSADPLSAPQRKHSGARFIAGLSAGMAALVTGTLLFSFSLFEGQDMLMTDPDPALSQTAEFSAENAAAMPSDADLAEIREIQTTPTIENGEWIPGQDRLSGLISRDLSMMTSMPAESSLAVSETTSASEEPAATTTRATDASGTPCEGLPVDQFTPDDTVFYVRSSSANVREMPGTAFQVIARLSRGDTITRTGYGTDWSKVVTSDGRTGFILTSLITADYVAKPAPTPVPETAPVTEATTTAPAETTAPPATETTAAAPAETAAPPATAPPGTPLSAEQQQAIIDLARAQIGVRYVYAKMDPAVGFDCSGLTSYIYKTLFNIKLYRSSKDQAGNGLAVVSPDDLQVGDILCFDWKNNDGICDHVGIYIGGGKYVHASSSDRTYYSDSGAVKEADVNFSWLPIISIRRIIY